MESIVQNTGEHVSNVVTNVIINPEEKKFNEWIIALHELSCIMFE